MSVGVYRIVFEDCAHVALIPAAEYGDGSAWCQRCGSIEIYQRCPDCGSFACESRRDDEPGVC